MSTLHFYQFRKKGEARNDNKVKTGGFWSNRLYNSFTQKLVLESRFESSASKSDTKDDGTKNTNIKKGGNYGNGQLSKIDVETVDISGDDASQGFLSYSNKEEVTPKLFDMSALPEVTSIYYIYSEENKLFHSKEIQNLDSATKICMDSVFLYQKMYCLLKIFSICIMLTIH